MICFTSFLFTFENVTYKILTFIHECTTRSIKNIEMIAGQKAIVLLIRKRFHQYIHSLCLLFS